MLRWLHVFFEKGSGYFGLCGHGAKNEADGLPARSAPDKRPLSVLMPQRVRRRISNERSVADAIRELGFKVTVVDLVPLTALEQMRLFAQHDIVLGMHGAALANTIFMRPRTLVIEAQPERMLWTCYGNIASWLGLGFVRLDGKDVDAESTMVKTDDVKRIMAYAEDEWRQLQASAEPPQSYARTKEAMPVTGWRAAARRKSSGVRARKSRKGRGQ